MQAHVVKCEAPDDQEGLLSRVIIPVEPAVPEPAPAPIPAPEAAPSQPVSASTTPTPAAEPQEPGRPGRPYVCKYCGKGYSKAPPVHMHISQAHKDKVDSTILNTLATCTICSKTFSKYTGLEQHMEAAHKEAPAAEPVPSTSTSTKPQRPKHRYYCPVRECNFFGYTTEDVHRHQRSKHWAEFVYRCNKCKFVSDDFEEYGLHQAKVHLGAFLPLGDAIILPCDQCLYLARGWEDFFTHIHTHTTKK